MSTPGRFQKMAVVLENSPLVLQVVYRQYHAGARPIPRDRHYEVAYWPSRAVVHHKCLGIFDPLMYKVSRDTWISWMNTKLK